MQALKKVVTNLYKQRWAWFFIIPGYIIFLLFNIIPTLRTVYTSFFDYNLATMEFAGLGNYIKLFGSQAFRASVRNTLLFAVIITPLSTVVSLLIATTIFPLGNKAQSVYRGAFFLPNVIGGVIISAIWLWIFHPVYGVLNYVLSLFGVQPLLWLADSKTVIFSVVLVIMSWTCGSLIILYVAGLGNIDPCLMEAAKIDGASPAQVFFRITLPLLKPVTTFIVTTQLINCFQLWEVIYLLTDGGPVNASTTLAFDIYKKAFLLGDYGLAAAEGVMLIVLCALVSLTTLRMVSGKEEK